LFDEAAACLFTDEFEVLVIAVLATLCRIFTVED
jgi:hypothetical protein